MSSIPHVSTVSTRLAGPLYAAVLGVLLLYLAGFAHVDVIHDGAHDARHSAALPCH